MKKVLKRYCGYIFASALIFAIGAITVSVVTTTADKTDERVFAAGNATALDVPDCDYEYIILQSGNDYAISKQSTVGGDGFTGTIEEVSDMLNAQNSGKVTKLHVNSVVNTSAVFVLSQGTYIFDGTGMLKNSNTDLIKLIGGTNLYFIGGTFSAVGGYNVAVHNAGDGAITVKGGVITSEYNDFSSKGTIYLEGGISGTPALSISGGVIRNDADDMLSFYSKAVYNGGAGDVRISGDALIYCGKSEKLLNELGMAIHNAGLGNIIVEENSPGVKILSKGNISLYNTSVGEIEINGGVVLSEEGNAVLNTQDGGRIVVNGGEISSGGSGRALYMNAGNLTVNAGKITAYNGAAVYVNSGKAKLNGGNISSGGKYAVYIGAGYNGVEFVLGNVSINGTVWLDGAAKNKRSLTADFKAASVTVFEFYNFNVRDVLFLNGGAFAAQFVSVDGKYCVANKACNASLYFLIDHAAVAAQGKTYDGSTNIDVGLSAVFYNGATESDAAKMTIPAAYYNIVGSFDDKNVGRSKSLIVTITLKDNEYVFANGKFTASFKAIADILIRELTVNGMTAQDREYDKTKTVTLSGGSLENVSAGDIGNSDKLNFVSGFGIIESELPGVKKRVTANIILTGKEAVNYKLIQPDGLTVNIVPKELTITGITAVQREYDGTTVVVLKGGVLNGVIGKDTVTFYLGEGILEAVDAGRNRSVKTNIVLGGSERKNYTLVQPSDIKMSVSLKRLTIEGMAAYDKPYDGNVNVTFKDGVLVGVLPGDTAHHNVNSAQTASAGVGKKAVIFDIVLSGSDYKNYEIILPEIDIYIYPADRNHMIDYDLSLLFGDVYYVYDGKFHGIETDETKIIPEIKSISYDGTSVKYVTDGIKKTTAKLTAESGFGFRLKDGTYGEETEISRGIGILPRKIILAAIAKDKKYDGKDTAYVELIFGNLADGETFKSGIDFIENSAFVDFAAGQDKEINTAVVLLNPNYVFENGGNLYTVNTSTDIISDLAWYISLQVAATVVFFFFFIRGHIIRNKRYPKNKST
ncbi:MAG: YDG domain-containing protein [Clostridiales bacterium]|nr:YDG domain-containing protein [Clostridiales bacterium]